MSPLSASLSALIGQPVQNIDTPALVVDLDAMNRNLGRMAEFAKKHGLRWRPHAKLHNVMIGVTGGLRHGTVQSIIRVDGRGAMT